MANLSEEQNIELTKGIIRMLDQFGLDAEQQIRVLGFPEGTRTRTLRQHRENIPSLTLPPRQEHEEVSRPPRSAFRRVPDQF